MYDWMNWSTEFEFRHDLYGFYDLCNFNGFELTIYINLRFIVKNNSEDQ